MDDLHELVLRQDRDLRRSARRRAMLTSSRACESLVAGCRCQQLLSPQRVLLWGGAAVGLARLAWAFRATARWGGHFRRNWAPTSRPTAGLQRHGPGPARPLAWLQPVLAPIRAQRAKR
jgi:hypothetical protein